MAMNLGSSDSDDPDVILDVNTTPLIDVMLVLLVMLIITIPIQLHSVNLNMPTTNSPPSLVPPEVIKIDIDAKSGVFWQGAAIADDDELLRKLTAAAEMATQPEIHLRPDKLAKYEVVAKVLAATQRLGLTKLGILGNEQFAQ
jgi:biopolymer transport protein ExbD